MPELEEEGAGIEAAELFDVSGLSVIVTGGASGIGLAFVEALAENGARVTILDVDQAGLERELGRLRGQGWEVRGTAVDVTDRQGTQRAFDAAVAAYGRLDVVFANAGVDPGVGVIGPDGQRTHEGALENYDDERWNRNIEVNLNAVFNTLKAAARHMKPQRFGRIILTTSVASVRNSAWRRPTGREGRRRRPDAQCRPGAGELQHHRQRHRAGAVRHQHRRPT